MTRSLALVAVVLAFAAGCGRDAPPPATPTSTSTPTVQTPELTSASVEKTTSSISISDELRKECGISNIESVTTAPKFAFDESVIAQEDRGVLAKVGDCLTTGPLKGRSLTLIGRADPRGTDEYNMALGARRADAVAQYLGGLGVPASQMSDTSRGKLDATGVDEEGYRLDRRVDIGVR